MGFEQISLTAKRFDFTERHGDTFATAEFKRLSAGFTGHWVVSGKSSAGLPSVLLVLNVPMRGRNEADLRKEATELAELFIVPMAEHLATTPSAGEPLPRLSVVNRQEIFLEHMHQQFSKERIGDLNLQSQTEALFNMASCLEVIAPLKLIAEFQGVAVSTVETRIKIGRANGAIPKASVARATKKTLMKGK